jgi:hypothetical protein
MSFSLLVAYHVSIRGYIFIGFLHGATTAEAVLDSVGYYFGLEVIWEVAG